MLLSKLNLLILVSLCHTSLAAAANEVMFSGTFNSWSNDAATNPGIYSELAEDCIIDGGSYNEYFYSDPILIPAGEAYSFKAFVVSGYSNTGLISDCSGQCGLNTCAMTAGWYPDTGSNQALPVDLFRAQRYVLHFFPFGKKEDDILPAGNTCAANHCPLVAFEAVATTASPTVSPTVSPTLTSTQAPTHAPTLATTHASTTAPTHAPSLAPTPPPLAPTLAPTDSPTAAPTSQHPTSAPSASPSPAPTGTPYRPPPFDQDIEVDIEGLAEDDFPDELKGLFRLQHTVFLFLYATLALLIVFQIVFSDGLCSVMHNRHFISLFVFLGCILRLSYIVTTDLYSALSPFASLEYALRAMNEVFWFAAFAYLSFYWFELSSGMRKNAKNVDQKRIQLYTAIGCFTLLRAARAGCESIDEKVAVLVLKGCAGVYLIAFFVFSMYWGHKLLERLRSMSRQGSRNSNSSDNGATSMDAAMSKFTTFLVAETVVSAVMLLEHVVSIVLKEEEVVSLEKNPGVVFGLKVVQRGTEWTMMAILTYMVCLKSSSKDFRLPVLPTLTNPLLCPGSGWCASRPYTKAEDELIQLIDNPRLTSLRIMQLEKAINDGLPAGWRGEPDEVGGVRYMHEESGKETSVRPVNEVHVEMTGAELRELVRENRELKKEAQKRKTIGDTKVHKFNFLKRKKSVEFAKKTVGFASPSGEALGVRDEDAML